MHHRELHADSLVGLVITPTHTPAGVAVKDEKSGQGRNADRYEVRNFLPLRRTSVLVSSSVGTLGYLACSRTLVS